MTACFRPLLAALLFAAPAWATDRYVSPATNNAECVGENDPWDCCTDEDEGCSGTGSTCSEEVPCATIAAGITASSNGDTIHVLPGTYTGISAVSNTSWDAHCPRTVSGVPGGSGTGPFYDVADVSIYLDGGSSHPTGLTIIKAAAATADPVFTGGEGAIAIMDGITGTTISGLEFRQVDGTNPHGIAICDGSDDTTIQNVVLSLKERTVASGTEILNTVAGADDVTFTNVEIFRGLYDDDADALCHSWGQTISGAYMLRIDNSDRFILQDSYWHHLASLGYVIDSDDGIIRRNRFMHWQEHGFYAQYSPDDWLVENNIFDGDPACGDPGDTGSATACFHDGGTVAECSCGDCVGPSSCGGVDTTDCSRNSRAIDCQYECPGWTIRNNYFGDGGYNNTTAGLHLTNDHSIAGTCVDIEDCDYRGLQFVNNIIRGGRVQSTRVQTGFRKTAGMVIDSNFYTSLDGATGWAFNGTDYDADASGWSDWKSVDIDPDTGGDQFPDANSEWYETPTLSDWFVDIGTAVAVANYAPGTDDAPYLDAGLTTAGYCATEDINGNTRQEGVCNPGPFRNPFTFPTPLYGNTQGTVRFFDALGNVGIGNSDMPEIGERVPLMWGSSSNIMDGAAVPAFSANPDLAYLMYDNTTGDWFSCYDNAASDTKLYECMAIEAGNEQFLLHDEDGLRVSTYDTEGVSNCNTVDPGTSSSDPGPCATINANVCQADGVTTCDNPGGTSSDCSGLWSSNCVAGVGVINPRACRQCRMLVDTSNAAFQDFMAVLAVDAIDGNIEGDDGDLSAWRAADYYGYCEWNNSIDGTLDTCKGGPDDGDPCSVDSDCTDNSSCPGNLCRCIQTEQYRYPHNDDGVSGRLCNADNLCDGGSRNGLVCNRDTDCTGGGVCESADCENAEMCQGIGGYGAIPFGGAGADTDPPHDQPLVGLYQDNMGTTGPSTFAVVLERMAEAMHEYDPDSLLVFNGCGAITDAELDASTAYITGTVSGQTGHGMNGCSAEQMFVFVTGAIKTLRGECSDASICTFDADCTGIGDGDCDSQFEENLIAGQRVTTHGFWLPLSVGNGTFDPLSNHAWDNTTYAHDRMLAVGVAGTLLSCSWRDPRWCNVGIWNSMSDIIANDAWEATLPHFDDLMGVPVDGDRRLCSVATTISCWDDGDCPAGGGTCGTNQSYNVESTYLLTREFTGGWVLFCGNSTGVCSWTPPAGTWLMPDGTNITSLPSSDTALERCSGDVTEVCVGADDAAKDAYCDANGWGGCVPHNIVHYSGGALKIPQRHAAILHTNASFCGDGVIDDGEDCDEGADNNNNSADACRLDCSNPGCGDWMVDTGEDCDDGNTTPGDGCSATCQTEAGGGEAASGVLSGASVSGGSVR